MTPQRFAAWASERRRLVDAALDRALRVEPGPAGTVGEAMRYAVLGGGKRLRPLLVLAACEACGGDTAAGVEPAAAIEMLHTYSLIHDDLPAMDDDDLRRGKLTVHKVFGEAAAVLAGDALLTLAFEILATCPSGERAAPRRAEAVALVSRAAGLAGMVGGQIADLEAENREIDLAAIEWIHRHKTGALLSASAELGAVVAGAPRAEREALARFGTALGLAFQVADDILDVTSTAEQIGKTPGKDHRSGKATYPALLGTDGARAEARRWLASALEELAQLPSERATLEAIARSAVERTR